jgi:4-hydroxy-tetrahydrodipicolinate synthase
MIPTPDLVKNQLASFGANMKEQRLKRDWTLDELADRSGLSKPFLSRLEAGNRQASIAAVLTLSQVFGVSLAALFETPPVADPCLIVRKADAAPREAHGLIYVPLSRADQAFNLRPLRVTVSLKRKGHQHYQHEGEEWIYVLSGKLTLSLAGHTYDLEEGDAVHFDSRMPHRVIARGNVDAEILLIASPLALERSSAAEASRFLCRSAFENPQPYHWLARSAAVIEHAPAHLRDDPLCSGRIWILAGPGPESPMEGGRRDLYPGLGVAQAYEYRRRTRALPGVRKCAALAEYRRHRAPAGNWQTHQSTARSSNSMNRNVPLQGIIGYPITPFTSRGELDLPKYRELLERLVAAGVHAVAPLGSAGVLPYLSDGEREAVTSATMEQVAGRVPVMIGISSLTTERVVHHAAFAHKAGAAALMVIPMSYWKLTEKEILRHYRTIASATPLPIMAYNNPATGGLDMSPDFLAKLLEIPSVTMIKESTGDVNRLHRLVQTAGPEVAFFNGSNPLALDAFVAGARGWCTAAPNLIPRLNLELYSALQANDLPGALRVFRKQLPLLQFIVQGGLPRTVAAGLEILGIDPGRLRAPLAELEPADKDKLRGIMAHLG